MAKTAEQLMREMSEALLKVRPLGGSEMFTRYTDSEYVADPEYCGQLISELRVEASNLRREIALLQRDLGGEK